MPLRRNIDIDLLRAFVTIVETGSFTRTAERLLRTQSAVSLQIRRLEESLNIIVFERGRKPAMITPDGEQLLVHARAVLAANDAMVTHLLEPEVRGIVRVGAPEFFGSLHLASLAARFGRAYQQASIEITCGVEDRIAAAFAGGDLDLMLGTSLVAPLGSRAARAAKSADSTDSIWHEPLIWVGHDNRGARRDVALRLVAAPAGAIENAAATTALAEIGCKWTVVYTSACPIGQCAAVAAGLGVAALPRSAAIEAQHRGNLFSGEAGLPALPDIEVRLLRHSEAGVAANRFADFMVAALAAHDHS
ncbi:MAG: LysR family transcriptional regulator [Polymorphobacter sp.]